MAGRKRQSRKKTARRPPAVPQGGRSRKPPRSRNPKRSVESGLGEASRERLRLIASFSGKVVGDEPLARQAQETAEQVKATFGVDACIIRLLEGEELVLLAATGVPREMLHPRMPIDWGIAREIISKRRPIFIPDVGRNPATARVRNRMIPAYGFISYAGTPLLVKDHVIGIFGIYTLRRMEDFTDADFDYLQIFGNNLSAAILNERLYAEATRQRDLLEAEIGERRRAEQALRESEDRYRRVVEDLSEFVVRWQPDGTRTFVNESYCRYFGLTREQAIGQSFLPLMTQRDREEKLRQISALAPRGSVNTAEHAVRRGDGGIGWTEWTDRPLFDEHGRLREIQSVGRDITERKRLQEQLAQARKMQSIGTLAGGIAHDFGNVLAVILGNVSLLQRQAGLSPKARELLADVATAAERGSAFTQQLLTYAHGTARQLATFDLNRLTRMVFRLLERIKSDDIEVVQRLAEPLSPVMADEVQIEQVVMNLGMNAIEASRPPAQIEVATGEEDLSPEATEPAGRLPGRYVYLSVRDHGAGMDAAVVERIFEPFFTTKPMGRGMGLATTRAIIDDHKGEIRVESEPGQGTLITVYLPVAAT